MCSEEKRREAIVYAPPLNRLDTLSTSALRPRQSNRPVTTTAASEVEHLSAERLDIGEGFRMPAGAGRGSGRGPAYENRPSTNPRACGAGLWGFRVLAERDDGGVGSAMAPTGTR